MLEKVKTALGITGTYQDAILQIYIDEVIAFLTDAGVSATTLNSNAATGIIVRGVADLWNYGSGGTSFSPYFMQRAIQLACGPQKNSGQTNSGSSNSSSNSDNTNDYNSLSNKPSIDDVTLIGDNSLSDFGLNGISNSEISQITKWEK